MSWASLTGLSSVWVVVMTWLAGGGVPLGVPPLPEDRALCAVAPEKCLFYMTSAGMASADSKSPNQTEQLMAEPELRDTVAAIEKAIKTSLAETMKLQDLPEHPSADEIIALAKLPLLRPWAVYISRIETKDETRLVRGGAIVQIGDNVEKVKADIDELVGRDLPVPIEKVTIAGRQWRQIKAVPGMPIVWGTWEKYLLLGIGEGEVEAMMKRAEGQPPAFLAKLRSDLPVARLSTITYINLRAVAEEVVSHADPQAVAVWKALGLDSLTDIRAVTGLEGEGFVGRTMIGTDGAAPRGIFRLAEIKPLGAGDLSIIPHDAVVAAALKLNPEQVFNTVQAIVAEIEPGAKERMDQGVRQMEAVMGVKLRDDILRPLGDTWRIFESPGEGASAFGLLAVVSLNDAKRAAATDAKIARLIEATLASAPADNMRYGMGPPKLHAVEFAGKKIHVYDPASYMMPFDVSWCVTDKELILSAFPQSIKAYLSRPADFQSLASSAPVAECLRQGGGPFKLIYVDSRQLFDGMYSSLLFYSKYFPLYMRYMRPRDPTVDFTTLLPSPRSIRPHLGPGLMTVRRTAAGIEVVERHALPGAGVSAALPVGMGTLLFGLGPAMGASQRASAMNNLRQLSLSMLTYESSTSKFPPAYKADKNGKPLLSWRVLVLPYMGQNELYEKFHLDEPWDSPHNKKLIARMPAVYKAPGSKVSGQWKTNYLAVRGEDTVLSGEDGTRMSQITDGASYTVVVVEASDKRAVIWTKPDDFTYDEKKPIKGLVGLRRGGFLAGFVDGHTQFIKSSIDPAVLSALFTRDGGETINEEELR